MFVLIDEGYLGIFVLREFKLFVGGKELFIGK